MIHDNNYNVLEATVVKYIRYWDRDQVLGSPSSHCIHPDDTEILTPNASLDLNICFQKSHIDQYSRETDSRKIHVDLIPSPYMGDIVNAKVLIFMNNPGIGKQDKFSKSGKINKSYLGEYPDHEREDVRSALISTLKQDMGTPLLREYRFAFLHPELHDTEGGKYALRKLKSSIMYYSQRKSVSMEIGVQDYANNICFLQHYPYHCGNEPEKYQSSLLSHKRMQEFYQEFIPIVCQRADRLIVLVRGTQRIRELTSGSNVIDYLKLPKGASNRAHFSVNSDGLVGSRIAEHLLEKAYL